MQEIGALLKKERQEKGISLEDISQKTKIQVRYLQALEEGDFSCFAGKVYLKGALRNYADSIGINAGELISYYERVSGEKSSEKNGEKKDEKHKSELFQGKERQPFPVVPLIWVILLGIIFGGSIWYRYLGSPDREQQIPFQRGVTKEAQGEENNAENAEEETAPSHLVNEEEPEESPQLVQISSDRREAVYLLKGVEKAEMTLHFTAKCWAQIEQDGAFIEQKNYSQGEVKKLPGDGHETKIRLGNPPGAWLEVNGLELNDWREVTNPINIIIIME